MQILFTAVGFRANLDFFLNLYLICILFSVCEKKNLDRNLKPIFHVLGFMSMSVSIDKFLFIPVEARITALLHSMKTIAALFHALDYATPLTLN